jgi:hypothetical protein
MLCVVRRLEKPKIKIEFVVPVMGIHKGRPVSIFRLSEIIGIVGFEIPAKVQGFCTVVCLGLHADGKHQQGRE